MKKFLTLFTVILAFTLVAPHAEAKRFGGGKSFGKSYKTAPAPRQQPQQTNNLQKQQPTKAAPASNAKKGFMGGLLGGLLAGGMLAALFGSGAFEGIQFMDILLIAILAFIGFKLFKMLRRQKATPTGHREAYAGNAPRQAYQQPAPQPMNYQAQNQYNGSVSDVPFNVPAGFDVNGFAARARDHYVAIQNAWNQNDLTKIAEYVSPAILNELQQERQQEPAQLHTEVLFVNAEVVRIDHSPRVGEISVKFTGRYRDNANEPEQNITDIWHLERDLTRPNSPWLIVGIQN